MPILARKRCSTLSLQRLPGMHCVFNRLSVLRVTGLALALWINAPAALAAWHHPASPFRARLKVTSQPNHAKAGIKISVPVCGLGRADGKDLFMFDEQGTPVQALALGHSADNSVIAVAESRPTGSTLYAYFGSDGLAPQNQRAFIPGPLVHFRTFPGGEIESWEQVEQRLSESRHMGSMFVDRIDLVHNPLNSRDAFIMDFRATLRISRPGEYTYMLVSDDAGYLWIDGDMLIDHSGRHWAKDAQRGENRQSVTLAEGLHELRCLVVEAGGGQAAVVAEWKDGRNKHTLKPGQFVQSGQTTLESLDARNAAEQPCASFRYRHRNYMSFEGRQYTLVELSTYNGKEAEWRFGDGASAAGAKVKHIFAGLDDVSVAVRQKQTTARGVVTFPDKAPHQLRLRNGGHFNAYAERMLKSNLRQLKTATLLAYRHFLNYREFNPQVVPVCEALLLKQELPAETRRSVLFDLARTAGAENSDRARKAYATLLNETGVEHPEYETLLREAGEFALWQAGDTEVATRLLKRLAKSRPAGSPAVLSLRLDIELQQGNFDKARGLLEELLEASELGERHRRDAVQSNALRERFYQLLRSGFVHDARRVYRHWAAIAPEDRMSGALPLARARLWKSMGWRRAAISELQAAIGLNPVLPNLPEAEYELAMLYQQQGSREQAQMLFEKIVEEYGNHPVAAEARKQLP